MSAIRNLIFKFGWDTRCRNVDVRRVLLTMTGVETTILDAGCGEYGLAAFMPSANITGVDILPSDAVDPRLKYVYGSIADLPFDDRSYDIAVSVDVLEHLPEDIRPEAVNQLVRVAKNVIVITFPAGEFARRIDESFAAELGRRSMPQPDWLEEHLRERYPEASEITAEIETGSARTGRKVLTKTLYSEHSSIALLLRRLAARSKYLYIAANLLAGVFLPLMPKANALNAYRTIVIAEFVRD